MGRSLEVELNKSVPSHVAIIMDGNGRWAKKRGLVRLAGHRAGTKRLKDIVQAAKKIGVRYMTVYAFSTENWKRPTEEVDGLMDLLIHFLEQEIDYLDAEGVQFTTIGDIEKLPNAVYTTLVAAKKRTETNEAFTLNVALNYGGRDEIVAACKNLTNDVLHQRLSVEAIDAACFSRYLQTKDMPDPDLVIRTSGELRISNFLLWQIAYSEFYITETLWPDFTANELYKAIEAYQQRERRYGGLAKE